MSSKRDKDKIANLPDDDDSDSGSTGQGGSKIDFHDFTAPSRDRDDNLPPDELKRLLAAHNDAQESRVQKQKDAINERKKLREGKNTLKNYREGLSSGMQSQYPPHPILSEKFRGADPQINPNPSENISQANEADRNELQHEYQLRHQPDLVPRQKFNPKPQIG